MKISKFLYLVSLTVSCILLFIFYNQVIQYLPKANEYSEFVNSTLYVDKDFNDDEVKIISQSALEWQQATKNRVTYNIIRLTSSKMKLDTKNGIIINKISESNIEVISLDYMNDNITLGYYNANGFMPHIGIISNRLDDGNYKTVILHELGHSLGLEHNVGESGIDTIMYPFVEMQSENISETDIKNYCKLHHCKL